MKMAFRIWSDSTKRILLQAVFSAARLVQRKTNCAIDRLSWSSLVGERVE